MGCPGLHCDGCGKGGLPVLPIVAVAAVAAFGGVIATVLEDILTAALITLSLAVVGVAAAIAVRVRTQGVWLVSWNKPELPAAEPVQAIQWPHVPAEVISRRDVPQRPAIKWYEHESPVWPRVLRPGQQPEEKP
jgi:hypothetical protein